MQHRLYIGNRSTGIVVAPDHRYPSLYRIHWPDREPSDIANLTRCKDAAMQWAARQHRQDHGNSSMGRLDFKWKDGQSQ